METPITKDIPRLKRTLTAEGKITWLHVILCFTTIIVIVVVAMYGLSKFETPSKKADTGIPEVSEEEKNYVSETGTSEDPYKRLQAEIANQARVFSKESSVSNTPESSVGTNLVNVPPIIDTAGKFANTAINKGVIEPVTRSDAGAREIVSQSEQNINTASMVPQNFDGAMDTSNTQTKSPTGQPNGDGNGSVDTKTVSKSVYIKTDKYKQKSPYTLWAGSNIPAILAEDLVSEKSGMVRATVRQNIYDSANHRYILIPQGSTIVGVYDNNVVYGDQRIAIAFTQLYYPDGQYVDLKSQPATDGNGGAGLSDLVDNHYWRTFGSNFIMGTIQGALASQSGGNTTTQSITGATTPPKQDVNQAIANNLGTQMGQSTMQIAQKSANTAPTITIRAGITFNVQLTSSLVLPPDGKDEE